MHQSGTERPTEPSSEPPSERLTELRSGRLYGVGLGPGDPSLMTVRAVEVIAGADAVAYHSARHGRSIARSIAARHLRPGQIEEPLVYPLTTETTDHPGGYRGAMDEFYEEAAVRLAAHLDAGRSVAVLAEGDPLFYSSYMHMHKRLAHRYPTEVIPGVTSVSAAAARLGTPLVEAEEVLTVLPGTLPEEELTARLAATDSAVVMKLGRTFGKVRRALDASGRLAEAKYVERATMDGERTGDLAEVDEDTVPYFSVAVLPSRVDAGRPERERGEVVVVGTGPAGLLWLTPESRGALAGADDLVGYTTYLDRVPVRPGQTRHGSDNKVESERAEFALQLAARGRKVAVVSGGDPGIFAMATAVLEVASEDAYRDIPVQVLPGVTAANAAAARAGAPSGTTTRPSRCPTGSSRGRSSRNACTRRPRPIWCSPCTTRARARAPGRSARPASCCSNTARRTPRWWSPAMSAAPRSGYGSWPSRTWTRRRSTCARSC